MREYGKTKSAHWINPRLSGCARIMAAYLFGGAHCNWIGCFNCPPQYAAADTDLPLSRVKKAYAELVAEGLIKQFGKMIFLVNFFQIEKVDNPNTATSRFNELMQLPDGEHRAFVAREMLKYFAQYLKEEYKAQLLAIAETVSEPVAEPVAQPLAHGYANRDRDSIYKSKAQQQQLDRPGASAAPPPTSGNGSLTENFPAKPKLIPTPDAEPANGPQSIAGLLTRATKAMAPEGARPADLPAEHPAKTATPESHNPVTQTVPVSADPAVETEIDYSVAWNLGSIELRYVLLDMAGVDHQEIEHYAAYTWWQFAEPGRKKLFDAFERLRRRDTAPAVDDRPTAAPESHNPAPQTESVPADLAVDLKTPKIDPATQAAPPPANPDSDLNAMGAPLTLKNDPDKGFTHADPKATKNERLQTVSENPVQLPLTEAAFLQTVLPQGVEIAIWHDFERMVREKVRWSAATCSTFIRQLRQAVANGADGNAVLEWCTVRSLIDLPDAWQRMQADAAKKKAGEQQEAVAAQSQGATEEPVTETVSSTVTGTVSEGVSVPVSVPVASEKPKQNLKKPDESHGSTGKSKKKAKRQAEKPDDVSDDTWEDFVEHRNNLKISTSGTVVKMFRKQAQKARISLDEAMQIAVAQGWRGFRAEWLERITNNQRMQHVGGSAAYLTPNASGRLPGESVSDAAMRVYVAKQEKRARGELEEPLKINLFNTTDVPALPVLPIINGDETK